MLVGFLDVVDAQHERAVSGLWAPLEAGDPLLIGARIYAEIRVRRVAAGTAAIVEESIEAAAIEVIAVDRPVAWRAADLRSRHGRLRPPDGLSLAAALCWSLTRTTFDECLARVAARGALVVARPEALHDETRRWVAMSGVRVVRDHVGSEQ